MEATFTARLKQENLAIEADVDDIVKKTDIDNKPKQSDQKI